jgi:hypothetical protein
MLFGDEHKNLSGCGDFFFSATSFKIGNSEVIVVCYHLNNIGEVFDTSGVVFACLAACVLGCLIQDIITKHLET